MKGRKGFLLRTTRQIDAGAAIVGGLFLLYLFARALDLGAVAGVLAAAMCVSALYVCASAASGRRRDKTSVSYSLLWGTLALFLLSLLCVAVTVKLMV